MHWRWSIVGAHVSHRRVGAGTLWRLHRIQRDPADGAVECAIEIGNIGRSDRRHRTDSRDRDTDGRELSPQKRDQKPDSAMNWCIWWAGGGRQSRILFRGFRTCHRNSIELLNALTNGDVDLFAGFSGPYVNGATPSGRLFKIDPNIFTKNENLRTTPGAVVRVKP